MRIRLRTFFSHSALLLAGVCAGLVASELFLIVIGKYQDPANPAYRYHPSLIFAPVPHTQSEGWHPVSRAPHPIHFNNLGARHNRDISSKEMENSLDLFFFGDSFLALRYLPYEKAFTTLLESALKRNFPVNVLNFGVSRWGTDQSFLRYSEIPEAKKAEYIFYVFCINDLLDLYENDLFRLENGRLVQQDYRNREFFLKSFFARLRLTYLFFEARSILYGSLSHFEPGQPLDRRLERARRFLPPLRTVERIFSLEGETLYATSLIAPEETVSWPLFLSLLHEFKTKVESNGSKFVIVTLPREEEARVAQLIKNDYTVIDLLERFRERLPNYDYSKYRYLEDGHWNEKAQYFAAQELYYYIRSDRLNSPRTLTLSRDPEQKKERGRNLPRSDIR